MCLIQIGSGSANLDTYIDDGFTSFIKKKKIKSKILIVEANPAHLNNLKNFWRKNLNVKIFNLAVIPDNINQNKMQFFYCQEDAPNYQIFSNSKSFVKKHFPNGTIKTKIVNCIKVSVFLKKNNVSIVDYLSIDIEGMDYEVLMNLDLKKFDIKNISFEHLHLKFFWQKVKIIFKFIKHEYFFSGMGFDLRKSDWMFTKKLQLKKINYCSFANYTEKNLEKIFIF
ncbi:MAG: hypothetical protein CM1200mP13_17140 [Candidatus Pelagibacterales bacterium]|nr:MAG: hypothetical protein CM1200mP13_17140 [Pelagibacterales bacterium]